MRRQEGTRMQAIREVGLKLDKTTAFQPLMPRLNASSIQQVKKLMAQMKANYPNQELTPETGEIWAPQWLSMVERYGLTEFRQVLMSLLASSKFFPQPHEIGEELSYITRERNRKER